MFDTNRAPIMRRNIHYLQKDRKQILHHPRHLGVPSDASKMISKYAVRLVQTMHLSLIKISTISKWTKTSFHLNVVT
jgi:hypothetical protein